MTGMLDKKPRGAGKHSGADGCSGTGNPHEVRIIPGVGKPCELRITRGADSRNSVVKRIGAGKPCELRITRGAGSRNSVVKRIGAGSRNSVVKRIGAGSRHSLCDARNGLIPAASDGQAGFSIVELLIALTLLAFLAASLLTIITSGSDAFQKVLDDKSAQSEARIAISYITVKLRQNSSAGKVSIVPSDSMTNARSVLKIEGDPNAFPGGVYFIYFEEAEDGGTGCLVEKNADAPHVGDPSNALVIADISDFSVSYAGDDKSVISVSVSCDAPGGRVTRDVSIKLRAA